MMIEQLKQKTCDQVLIIGRNGYIEMVSGTGKSEDRILVEKEKIPALIEKLSKFNNPKPNP